jgi:type-F conjugative transfer system pilin assembly protein TrbC
MPEVERRARTASKVGDERISAQREAMGKRLREALGFVAPSLEARPKAASAGDKWVPVLFVSSSMPIPVLRAYAAQLERVRGVLALRGMPGGLRKVGPMAKFTAEVLRLDSDCDGPRCVMRDVQVIVDPILFRQHGIARVPALAMIPGDAAEPYCERENAGPRAGVIVSGDSALSGLFAEYARLGGKKEVKDAQALLGDR